MNAPFDPVSAFAKAFEPTDNMRWLKAAGDHFRREREAEEAENARANEDCRDAA